MMALPEKEIAPQAASNSPRRLAADAGWDAGWCGFMPRVFYGSRVTHQRSSAQSGTCGHFLNCPQMAKSYTIDAMEFNRRQVW